MSSPITVLVADDHPPTRMLTRSILEDGGFVVVAEASDAHTAVQKAVDTQPQICLIDRNMPGRGLSAVRKIRVLLPQTAVVVFSMSATDEEVMEAKDCGAADFVTKDVEPSVLYELFRSLVADPADPRPAPERARPAPQSAAPDAD